MTLVIRCLASALMLGACFAGSLPDTPGRAATLTRLDEPSAGLVALRADEARRQALATLDTAGLTSTFGGRALQSLQDLVGRMRERGLRLEERGARRTVVFWDASRDEVTIQVESEHRLLSADLPNPPWTSSMRQWWSHLGVEGGDWRVVDDRDLLPDQWRLQSTLGVTGSDAAG